MKKTASLSILCAALLLWSFCAVDLTNSEDIVGLYLQNEAFFAEAASTGDFSAVAGIRGVLDVRDHDTYVDIRCGGSGIGPSTHYLYFCELDT